MNILGIIAAIGDSYIRDAHLCAEAFMKATGYQAVIVGDQYSFQRPPSAGPKELGCWLKLCGDLVACELSSDADVLCLIDSDLAFLRKWDPQHWMAQGSLSACIDRPWLPHLQEVCRASGLDHHCYINSGLVLIPKTLWWVLAAARRLWLTQPPPYLDQGAMNAIAHQFNIPIRWMPSELNWINSWTDDLVPWETVIGVHSNDIWPRLALRRSQGVSPHQHTHYCTETDKKPL